MFSRNTLIYIILFLCCMCGMANPLHAAFPVKNLHSASIQATSDSTSANALHQSDTPTPETKRHHIPGFLAYFGIGCGIIGLATIAIPSTLLMMLFGLTGGVAGKMGVNRYKHDKTYKALSYVAIVLGGILVILATIPILLLI